MAFWHLALDGQLWDVLSDRLWSFAASYNLAIGLPIGLFIGRFCTAEAALGIYIAASYAMLLVAPDFVILRGCLPYMKMSFASQRHCRIIYVIHNFSDCRFGIGIHVVMGGSDDQSSLRNPTYFFHCGTVRCFAIAIATRTCSARFSALHSVPG